MSEMGQIATVTSKSMVTIPSAIRRKYSLRQGSKVEFVETEDGIFVVPVKTLKELRGAAGKRSKLLIEAARELEQEHREEARSDEPKDRS
jgi:AbrB family looped-hinge helix DNA binding protein